MAVFPGSAYLWRRHLEATFRVDFSGKLVAYLMAFRALVIFTYRNAKSGAPEYILSQGTRPRIEAQNSWKGITMLANLLSNLRVQRSWSEGCLMKEQEKLLNAAEVQKQHQIYYD